MPRFKLIIEYDGTNTIGWQKQRSGNSIQAMLEAAGKKFCGLDLEFTAAGRTDAGVHALAQVVHTDITKDIDADTVQGAFNFHLKEDPVSVLQVEQVDENFHARFSATGRSYVYKILNRRAPPVIDQHRVWHIHQSLNDKAMHDAAQVLIGTHDFSSFRDAECQAKSPIKTLDTFQITKDGEMIVANISAKSFLHHQVRNMIGTLKLVGEGKWTKTDVKAALDAKDRTKAGMTAPPHGLYLTAVRYD